MLSKQMEQALNDQLNAELHSGYLYLSMSACFTGRNLHGFAQWMKVQAQEELAHAMKFYAHILERGSSVSLQPVGAVPTDWKSPLAAFQDAYAHEQKVTALIDDLVNKAVAAKDHATNIFLQWFVTEQVEEEASASEIVQKLNLVGDNVGGLMIMDGKLGQRGK